MVSYVARRVPRDNRFSDRPHAGGLSPVKEPLLNRRGQAHIRTR
jgi:hypothetical protein